MVGLLIILNHNKNYYNKQDINIIYYYNPSCSTCAEIEETVKQVLDKLSEYGEILYINTQNPSNSMIIKKYNINTVPLIIITDNNLNELVRFDNIKNESDIRKIYYDIATQVSRHILPNAIKSGLTGNTSEKCGSEKPQKKIIVNIDKSVLTHDNELYKIFLESKVYHAYATSPA